MLIWMNDKLEEIDEVKVKNSEAVEEISALVHMAWCDWASTVLETEDISEERETRWKKYFVAYEDLEENVKELDRIWARRILKAIKKRK